MAKLNRGTISRRTVQALPVGDRETVFWNRELSGIGVRVYPSGAKVYVAQTRARGKSGRTTIGRHGVLSADQARRKAAELIARVKAGVGSVVADGTSPSNTGPTVAEAAHRYFREHVAVRCKPKTADLYRFVLTRHIAPVIGSLPLRAIGRPHVAALHYRFHETPTMAKRVVEVLSRLYNMAEAWGIVPEGTNPCRFVRKYEERSHERFLSNAGAEPFPPG